MKRVTDIIILIGLFLVFSSEMKHEPTTEEPAKYISVSKPSDAIEVEAMCLENQYQKKLHEAQVLLLNR